MNLLWGLFGKISLSLGDFEKQINKMLRYNEPQKKDFLRKWKGFDKA